MSFLFARHYCVLGAEEHFSVILEIAAAILFLTTEKCNRHCNSASFLNLHSETSIELNAARKKPQKQNH